MHSVATLDFVWEGEGCLGLDVTDDDTQDCIQYFGVEDTLATLGAAILARLIAAVARRT